MMKALIALALFAIVSSAFAAPQSVTLVRHNSRSGSGTLSTLQWAAGCAPVTGGNCYNYANPWVSANIDPGASTAAWTWDAATGVLASTGLFITSSFVSSSASASGSSVLGDRVVDLTIDTTNSIVTGTNYRCIEGTFLAGVGSNACGAYSLGGDFVNSSSVAYNVGGNPYCEQRTLGGDDTSTGNPRGLRTQNAGDAGAGCDATTGAFNLFTIASNSGGFLILSNGICLGTGSPDPSCANVNYMTFAVPVPAAVWMFGSALGLLGWVRRRTLA